METKEGNRAKYGVLVVMVALFFLGMYDSQKEIYKAVIEFLLAWYLMGINFWNSEHEQIVEKKYYKLIEKLRKHGLYNHNE